MYLTIDGAYWGMVWLPSLLSEPPPPSAMTFLQGEPIARRMEREAGIGAEHVELEILGMRETIRDDRGQWLFA